MMTDSETPTKILTAWTDPTWLWSARVASKATGCSHRAANRALKRLHDDGKITRFNRNRWGRTLWQRT